jgi:hypothetical protein
MKNVLIRCLVLICMIFAFSSSVWAERPIRILALNPISGPTKDLGEKFLLGTEVCRRGDKCAGGGYWAGR